MKDKLGQDLAIGDEVIVATGARTTEIGKIGSIGKKMITVKKDGSYISWKRYPKETLKIGGGAEKSITIPEDIAKTILHAARLAVGFIPDAKIEEVDSWVNDMIWTKE
jgi:hypothetical protein